MVNKKDPGKDRKKSEDEKDPLEQINYPPEEDIMNPASGATRVPPETGNPDRVNPGDSLDVPGSELDDNMEDIGEEDEENNYYSLGGDKDD
jgi:hypothetical protein